MHKNIIVLKSFKSIHLVIFMFIACTHGANHNVAVFAPDCLFLLELFMSLAKWPFVFLAFLKS